MNESRAGAEELWNEAIADSGLNLAKLHRFARSGQYPVASSSRVSRTVQPRSFSGETRPRTRRPKTRSGRKAAKPAADSKTSLQAGHFPPPSRASRQLTPFLRGAARDRLSRRPVPASGRGSRHRPFLRRTSCRMRMVSGARRSWGRSDCRPCQSRPHHAAAGPSCGRPTFYPKARERLV
jgi:hypothetical protein